MIRNLLGSQSVNLKAERPQFGHRKVLILLHCDIVNDWSHVAPFCGQTAQCEVLIGETHVHDFRWMAFRRS